MIGSALTRCLAGEGHAIVRLVRREAEAAEVSWDPDAGLIDAAGLEGFDGVVNLANMVWPARWTPDAKKRLLANRLATNGLLAENLAKCKQKPRVLMCASGMGVYPSSGDQVITEESPLGADFLADMQREGEAMAMRAGAAGIRVVNLRIPMVLGGAKLKRNIGRIGDGRQWNSWIARDELASIINFILTNATITGAVNPVSPHPLRNAEFAATFSRALGSKPGVPVPAFLLRLMVGEMAEALILASRRIEPRKLLDAGYAFRFPTLEEAVHHEMKSLF
jgi:uncharacterized protein